MGNTLNGLNSVPVRCHVDWVRKGVIDLARILDHNTEATNVEGIPWTGRNVFLETVQSMATIPNGLNLALAHLHAEVENSIELELALVLVPNTVDLTAQAWVLNERK